MELAIQLPYNYIIIQINTKKFIELITITGENKNLFVFSKFIYNQKITKFRKGLGMDVIIEN